MASARVQLSGASVLLTGATGGLGHAIARALAGRGAQLTLTGRRADVLRDLAGELGGRALECDLASRHAVAALAQEAARADVLIANAALPASGQLTELTQEQIDRMLEVNLRAPIALAHALAPAMVARGAGHMVFISSLSGKTASPASSLYSATKFGLRGFALGARADLAEHGIGVSTILPGFISDAGMFADTGVRLRRGVGTRTSGQVAAAVLRVIDEDRAELDVAPLALRLGAAAGGLAPAAVAAVTRRLGSHEVAAQMAEHQRGHR
ncbi:MAG: SDR family NAD(P)-dependent oxidoreductase [Solirubrobacteraceae bacterium]